MDRISKDRVRALPLAHVVSMAKHRFPDSWVNLDTDNIYPLSSSKGGEGRGEEVTGARASFPSPQPSDGTTEVLPAKRAPRSGGARESVAGPRCALPQGNSIRVPLVRAKGLTQRTIDKIIEARQQGPFASLADFFHRTAPGAQEMEVLIRAGGFDDFGETRTRQFWQAQYLLRTAALAAEPGQGWLIPPPGLQPPAYPDTSTNSLSPPERGARLAGSTSVVPSEGWGEGKLARAPVTSSPRPSPPFEEERG